MGATEKGGKEWHVVEFYPADTQTLEAIWCDLQESKIFPFAADSFGAPYYVELKGKESNSCPVMCYHHDGNDVEVVSNSLEEFLGWHRGT